MKQYTDHDCLNKIIALAIEDGTITCDDIYHLVDLYGTNYEQISVDVLSLVYQRRKDKKKLEEMQTVYRRCKNGLQDV